MGRHKPRNVAWLFLGFVALSGLGFLIHSFAPSSYLMLLPFFSLLAVSVFSFTYFLLMNLRQALLLSAAAVLWLLLRYLELRELQYTVLLLATVASLELLYHKE